MEEEEAMPIPVQETPLTTCPPPSTAASIANLEYPEEPLPTAASVASEECLEPLPMALTDSSHEYLDAVKVDNSRINPEQTPVVCVWSYVHMFSSLACVCSVCTLHTVYRATYVLYMCAHFNHTIVVFLG